MSAEVPSGVPKQQAADPPDNSQSVVVPLLWPDAKAGPWRVELTFGLLDARIQCTGVQVSHQTADRAISQDLLRRVPLAKLIEEVRKDPPQKLTRLVLPGPFYKVGEMAQHNLGLLAPPEIPARLNDQFLERVAAIYRRSPSKPTTAVAEHFGVSQTRAANWVRRARMKGLIPSAKSSSQHSEES